MVVRTGLLGSGRTETASLLGIDIADHGTRDHQQTVRSQLLARWRPAARRSARRTAKDPASSPTCRSRENIILALQAGAAWFAT